MTISGSPNNEQLHNHSSHIYSNLNDSKQISEDSEEAIDHFPKSSYKSSNENRNNSSDSTEIDTNLETVKLKKELEAMTQQLIDSKLQVAELTGDVVQEKKKLSDMEKLLVSQSSSEIDPPSKKKSKWNFLCCTSENSVISMNPDENDDETNEITKSHNLQSQSQPHSQEKNKSQSSSTKPTKSKSSSSSAAAASIESTRPSESTGTTGTTKSKNSNSQDKQSLDSNSSHGKIKSSTVSTSSVSASSSSTSTTTKGTTTGKKEKNSSTGKTPNQGTPQSNQNGNNAKPNWLN